MNALHRAARQYRPRTIPLRPRTKLPAVSDWPNLRPTQEIIDWWWTQQPATNVGIRCGGGLVVLDVDPRAGADDDLADLEHEHGELPVTVTCETGGGGVHFYFAGPVDLPTWFLSPGLEVRSNGAQVVAPPSVHPDGPTYKWREGCAPGQVPRAPLPAWILEARPSADGAPTPPAHWVDEVINASISEGGRHNALLRLSGHLLRKYVDVQVVFHLVAKVNAGYKPPLPIDEVESIVDSVNRSELARRRREQVAA